MDFSEIPQGINYRQAGKTKGGRLIKGTNARTAGPVTNTTPSIPGKYETMLIPQHELDSYRKNSKGFSSQAPRFQRYEVEDVPGPGQYHKPRSFIEEKASYSKKGYGSGFVSKSQRFQTSIFAPVRAPGPGSYSIKDDDGRTKTRGTYSGMGTSSFVDSSKRAAIDNPRNDAMPGPGTYNHTTHTYRPHGKKKAFHTSSNRFHQFSSSISSPSPGTYSPITPSQSSKVAYKAAFNSKTDRSSFLRATNRNTPGPGQYDTEGRIYSEKKKPVSQRQRYNKSVSQRKEGVVKKSNSSNLGPGSYDINVPSKRTVVSGASAFKSKSSRIDYSHSYGPGPATYDLPSTDTRKNYHYSSKEMWY